MRIPARMAERGGDARFEIFRDDVLQPFRLVVDFIP